MPKSSGLLKKMRIPWERDRGVFKGPKAQAAGTPTAPYEPKKAKPKGKGPKRENPPSKPVNGLAGPGKGRPAAAQVKAKAKAKTTSKKTSKGPSGKPLGTKHTYTTSGTHAGGRKSSASRPIKMATSLKKKKAMSLRAQ